MMDQKGMVPWRPASGHFYELTPKQRREEDLLQPFYEEQMRQEHARRLHDIKNLEAAWQMRDRRRNLIYETFQTQVKRRRIKELYEVSTHACLVASWDALAKQDFSTEADVSEKMRREHHFLMDLDSHDYENELILFESKGYELGADTGIEFSFELKNKDKGKEKQKDTSKVLKEEKLPKKLKSFESSESTQDGSNVLSEIKEKVLKAEKEKFENEQKRRMDEYATKQREREIEEVAEKEKEEENRRRFQEKQALKTEELQAAENSEKEKHAVRLELEQQIAEQRNREWEAVLARDHEVLLMMKHDRDNEVNFEQRLWQEERQRKLEQRHLKHRNLCREALLQIINLAETSALYKESTSCALSSAEWWEWKNLFVRGAIEPLNLNIESLESDNFLLEDKELAQEASVMDYVNEQGEWEFIHPIGTNKELGNIILSLFHKGDLDPCSVPPAYLSSLQLKLAVLGSPFAGKTFVAKLLEDRFGIVLLEIDKIVASAIADATHEERTDGHQQSNGQGASDLPPLEQRILKDIHASEGTKVSTLSPRIALGQQARAAVSNGLQVPDEVAVQLLLYTLESLNHNESETPSVSPKDIKKMEHSPRVKGITETHPSSQPSSTLPPQKKIGKERAVSKDGHLAKKRTTGFILDGFPSTQHQAELLQRGLSGLQLVLESKSTQFKSLLAPPPEFESSPVKPSYPLDALFLLDPLEEGDALKQAMGKYVDPKTGLFYHLEFEPPPENDRTGIVSRVKPIEDVSAAGKRIKDGMLTWNTLFEWINTFSNAHLIHHDERRRFNLDETYLTIQGLLDSKVKISAAADAAKAAVEAEEAATRAACEAENAGCQAKAIAQKLFLAKFAEVEALTVLERSNNDPAAKDILKKKVSESTSRLLQEAAKAVKEAEASAETSKKAAEDACKVRQFAEEAASSVSAVLQAREEALAAAESAKLSALKAAAAYQRAQLAADSAVSNLTDTTNSLENSDKAFLKQKILDLSAQPTQSEVEKPVLVDNIFHASEADQDSTGTFFTEDLCKFWQDVEENYLNKLREFFDGLRLERKDMQKSLKEIKESLVMELKKQDERQAYLDDFQEAESNCHKSLSMWMQQRTEAVSQWFTLLVQIERERFLWTCCLLYEYLLKKSSSVIKERFADGTSWPSPRSKQVKNLPPLPGWLPAVANALPHLHQDPPSPAGFQPLPDLGCFHYQVVEELVKIFQEGNLKGYVPLLQATESVQYAVKVVHTLCKNDLTLSMIPRVPGSKSRPGGPFEVWKDYTEKLVKIPAENVAQVIDWRCFLVSLIDAHFHNFICGASAEDIVEAHIALNDAADEGSSFLQLPQLLGARLWFDTDNGYICGERMKQILYSMLSSDKGLPWQSLLLYLCKDSEVELALKKAHAAITGTLLENVTLTPQQLMNALYPCGPEGASAQGCLIWSSQEIKNMLQGESEQEAELVDSVKGTDESDDNLTYVRSTGACRGSKLSEQSLVSFEVMPSEPQSISEEGCGITTSISSEAISKINDDDKGTSNICSRGKRASNLDSANKRASKIDNKQTRMSTTECIRIRGSKMDDNEMRTSIYDHGINIDSTSGEKQDERDQEEDDTADSRLEVCSLFSEQAVATMNEFLAACNEALRQCSSNDKGGAALPNGSDEDNEVVFSLPYLLSSELSSALQARFCTNSLLVMGCASSSSK